MQFRVKFKSVTGCAIDIYSKPVGLKMLDQARTKFGPHIDDITDKREVIEKDPLIIIGEHTARESGRFAEEREIIVQVSAQQLNSFVTPSPYKQDDDYYARIRWEVDEKGIIEEWRKAGFPLDWRNETGYQETDKSTSIE